MQRRGVGGDAQVLGAARGGAPGVPEPEAAAAGCARRCHGARGAGGVRRVLGARPVHGAVALRAQVRVRRVPRGGARVPGVPRADRGLAARLRHLIQSRRVIIVNTILPHIIGAIVLISEGKAPDLDGKSNA